MADNHASTTSRSGGPRVSIGLPVYNAESSLARTLDSILSQDFEDFELVISDNASTDRTGDVCQAYANRDKRIRYFRNKTNCGVNPNHDRVFELSQGRYFMWSAHDVECLPGLLRRCVDVMSQAPPSVVLVYPRCEMIMDGHPVAFDETSSIESRDPRPYRRLDAIVSRVVMVNQLYGLMKTEALAKTQLNGPYASSDYVLLAELAMLGQIWELPEVLLRRRVDADRGTQAVHHDPKVWLSWLSPNAKRTCRGWLPYRERLAVEYLRAAWRLPLKPGDKFLCLATVLPVYYARTSATVRFALRLTRPLRHLLHLRRPTRSAASPGSQ